VERRKAKTEKDSEGGTKYITCPSGGGGEEDKRRWRGGGHIYRIGKRETHTYAEALHFFFLLILLSRYIHRGRKKIKRGN